MSELAIRAARLDEADLLTELAMRSKASWGYSDEFMAACRAELTFTTEKMTIWRVWVAELDGAVVGMIALGFDGEDAELEGLFVEAAQQGRGVGSALMNVLLAACDAHGAARVGLDADPNAEPIYEQLGFRRVGWSPSGSIPGRRLPRMERTL
jgi:GNAT superfamily N-acetyltransferase